MLLNPSWTYYIILDILTDELKETSQKTLGETEDVEGVLGKYLEDGEVAESGLEYGWKLSTVTFVNTN